MIRHTIKPQSSIRRNPLCVSWCSSAVPPQRALRNHTGPPRVRTAACRKPPTYQSAPSASGRNQPQLNVSAQEQQIHWDGAPANSLSKRVQKPKPLSVHRRVANIFGLISLAALPLQCQLATVDGEHSPWWQLVDTWCHRGCKTCRMNSRLCYERMYYELPEVSVLLHSQNFPDPTCPSSPNCNQITLKWKTHSARQSIKVRQVREYLAK